MYNPRKAAQVVAFFALKQDRCPLNVVKAVKLVYLADRENINRFGFPILDERRVSMKHGPVNSFTYDHIKGEVPPENDCGWSEFVSDRSGHNVGLASDDIDIDDLDELSDAEIQTLEAVWEKFGGLDQWALVRLTHDPNVIPEWRDPKSTVSRVISLSAIMEALEIPEFRKHAAEIENVARSSEYLKGL